MTGSQRAPATASMTADELRGDISANFGTRRIAADAGGEANWSFRP
jgi:hypothetical protein